MITNEGMLEIGETLTQRLGTHIAIGIGDETVNAADSDLQFEVWRGQIETRAYDPETNTIHLKASVPAELDVNVFEVGLLASGINEAETVLITSMDEAGETWDGTFNWTDANTRMGTEAIELTGGTAVLTGINSNLSSFGLKDYIQIASWSASSTTAATLTLLSDEDNYFETSILAPGGFNVTTVRVEDMTATGLPDLSNISSIEVSGNNIVVDAIRAVKLGGESRLIKRNVISPVIKTPGVSMDVEVSITL